jgi:uncharacterized protein YoxC
MHIIEYNNYEIIPTEEAFLIKPIRELYNADKSKTKEKFLQQMSILYFMVDPRSSYNYIIDDDDRFKAILEQEGLPKDYKVDKKLQAAMDIYKEHTMTSSYLLLQDMKVAIEKVRQFLREVDLNAVDDKGKPLYTINSVTTAIKQIPQLAKDVMEAEKIIAKEIEEQGRARGGNQNKKLFEDGF